MSTSDICHGTLGVRSGLRLLSEVLLLPDRRQQVLVELRPSAVVSGTWTAAGGGVYTIAYAVTYDGQQRDVVGCSTDLDAGLVRVADAATMTAGTYYYDFTTLYVYLEDGSDPANAVVSVQLGFYAGAHGEMQADLGPDLLASATPLTTLSGTSVGWTVTGLSTANTTYRLSGLYSPPADNGEAGRLSIWDSVDLGEYVDADGRTYGSGVIRPTLAATPRGEQRRFAFDFFAPAAACTIILDGSGGLDSVAWESVTLQWVRSRNFYDPRLASSNLPSLDVGKSDPFWGSAPRVGVGQLSILVADGALDEALGDLTWIGQEVVIRYLPTAAGDDGLIEAAQEVSRAVIQSLDVSDTTLTLRLEDVRSTLVRTIPPRTVDQSLPDADPQAAGKARPWLFGTVAGLAPLRVSVSGGYGVYEVCDCDNWPAGIVGIDKVYLYADADAARLQDATRRLELLESTEYTASAGRITLACDVPGNPIVIESGLNGILQFGFKDAGLTPYVRTVTLAPGAYTCERLAAHIQALVREAIAAVIPGDTTGLCTWDHATRKFTLGRSAGQTYWELNTGQSWAAESVELLRALGFTQAQGPNSDPAGSPYYANCYFDQDSYTSDEAVGAEPVEGERHVLDDLIRVDATGFADDSAGTYTSTPGAPIEYPTEVLRWLWRQAYRCHLDLVDEDSFADTDALPTPHLALYLSEPVAARDVLAAIERSAKVHVAIDGSGRIYCQPYAASAPDDTLTVEEADLLDRSWQESVDLAQTYGGVDVGWGRDPVTGTWQVSSADATAVARALPRPTRLRLDTYLALADDADILAAGAASICGLPRVRRKFTTHALLAQERPGRSVYLTKARSVLSSTGSLSAVRHEILNLKYDWLRGRISVDAIEWAAMA